MHDRLHPINEVHSGTEADKDDDAPTQWVGAVCLFVGAAAIVSTMILLFLHKVEFNDAADPYGFCRHTKHSKPNNSLPTPPNRTIPKWCPRTASRVCNGTQPDDPDCCIGDACCRCSNDATMYNPTPKIFTEFNNFSFDIHVVCADKNEPAFPARPNKNGTKGNMRFVGVALPEGKPPEGGWPVAMVFEGGEFKRNKNAVFDPDHYCNIENNGCGVNVTNPMMTVCHGPEGDPNAPPGWHLYSMFPPDGSTPWIDYHWHSLNFVSNYHSRRLERRLLLNGFAVINPSSWGPGGWCV